MRSFRFDVSLKKLPLEDRPADTTVGDLLINGQPAEDRTQTFYVTKGNGVTAKEAFNLLEGRSVQKELVNKEQEPYKAWLKLDFEQEKDQNNNYKVKQFSKGYDYDLEKSLTRFDIKELRDSAQKDKLVRSLQKGNLQQVTVEKEGKEVKHFVEANPQFKTINVFNDQHRSVKRETILKPEQQEKQSGQQIKQPKTCSRKSGARVKWAPNLTV